MDYAIDILYCYKNMQQWSFSSKDHSVYTRAFSHIQWNCNGSLLGGPTTDHSVRVGLLDGMSGNVGVIIAITTGTS